MKLGVSTFSLTNEWLSRRYTLESLLERVAEAALGRGWRSSATRPGAATRAFPARTCSDSDGSASGSGSSLAC